MSYVKRAQRPLTIALLSFCFTAFVGCQGPEAERLGTAPASPDGAVDSAAVAAPQASQTTEAKAAWSAKIDAISQPVVAGPAVLVIARAAGGRVELVSLDRKTGRRNFAMPFHPGGTPTGVVLTPKVTLTEAGRRLALVRRAAQAPLEAIDARTGAVVRTTQFAIDDYDACSDGTDVCWSGYSNGANDYGIVTGVGPTRWDLETGRVLENDGQEGARQIGTDLYFRGEGRTAVLARLRGSQRTAWSQSVSLVVAPGADPSYGWTFAHAETEDVYVGAMGRPVSPALIRAFRAGKRVEIDYRERYLTVAVDGRTGEQLWSRRGADPWCPLLRSTDDLDTRTVCVVKGTNVQQEGRDPRDKGLAVELQGVEPRSGDVSWSFELTGKDAVTAYADERAPLAPYGWVLPSPDGPVALDMRTGERQLMGDDTFLLCSAGPHRITVYGVDRLAGDLYHACTADARPVAKTPSVFGVAGLDGEGDVRFVSMPGRVVAFRL